MEVALVLLVLAAALWLSIVVPYRMARHRQRRPYMWVLVSLVFSPILAIPALFVLGATEPA